MYAHRFTSVGSASMRPPSYIQYFLPWAWALSSKTNDNIVETRELDLLGTHLSQIILPLAALWGLWGSMVEAHPTHHAMADKNFGVGLFPILNPSLGVADRLAATGSQELPRNL
jgi:hypothetical protein